MRLKLPLDAALFAFGIAAADAALGEGAATAAALSAGATAAAACALAFAWPARNLRAKAAALSVAAFALGVLAYSARAAPPWPAAALPQNAVVDARIAARTHSGGGARVLLDEARAVAGPAVPRRLQLWLQAPELQREWIPGARVRAKLQLRAFGEAANPGGYNAYKRARREGVGARARVKKAQLAAVTAQPACAPCAALHRTREAAAQQLFAQGRGGALLAALALGDRRALPPPDRQAAARAGVAHLLAVSGLHLAMLAGGVAILFGWLLRRFGPARGDVRRPALAAALLAALFYVAWSGAQVPVQRAFVFLAALAVAFVLRRPVGTAPRLSLAALIVLIADPAALFAPGAQLSFAAVWALSAARPAGNNRAAELLAASAIAAAATAPLAALHFGANSPFGWLANIVAIPVTTFLLLPLALISSLFAALHLPFAETIISGAAALAEFCLNAVGRWAAFVPAPGIGMKPALYSVALAALLVWAALRSTKLIWRALFTVAIGAVLGFGPSPALQPPPPRAVFFDVGWGDAALVEGRGARILVDGGGGGFAGLRDAGERVVLPSLAALGVRRLDVVIASHADIDHQGGLHSILQRMPVDELWLPFGGLQAADFEKLRAIALGRGVQVREVGAGTPLWRRGDVQVQPLWPPPGGGPGSSNERSLVVRVTADGGTLLLTGDLDSAGELELLTNPDNVRAHWLKLGHHGSRSSSHGAFLRAVQPCAVVASAPLNHRYLPHPSVLARVRELGLPLLWTGRDGAAVINLQANCAVRWSETPHHCKEYCRAN